MTIKSEHLAWSWCCSDTSGQAQGAQVGTYRAVQLGARCFSLALIRLVQQSKLKEKKKQTNPPQAIL